MPDSPSPIDPSGLEHVVDDAEALEEAGAWAVQQFAEGRTLEELTADLQASGWGEDEAASISEAARRATRHLRGVVSRDAVAGVADAGYRRSQQYGVLGMGPKTNNLVGGAVAGVAASVYNRRQLSAAEQAAAAPSPASPEMAPWTAWARSEMAMGKPPDAIVAELAARGWPLEAARSLIVSTAAGGASAGARRRRKFSMPLAYALVGAGMFILGFLLLFAGASVPLLAALAEALSPYLVFFGAIFGVGGLLIHLIRRVV